MCGHGRLTALSWKQPVWPLKCVNMEKYQFQGHWSFLKTCLHNFMWLYCNFLQVLIDVNEWVYVNISNWFLHSHLSIWGNYSSYSITGQIATVNRPMCWQLIIFNKLFGYISHFTDLETLQSFGSTSSCDRRTKREYYTSGIMHTCTAYNYRSGIQYIFSLQN